MYVTLPPNTDYLRDTHLQTPYDAFYVGKRPQRHVSHQQAGLVVDVTVSCANEKITVIIFVSPIPISTQTVDLVLGVIHQALADQRVHTSHVRGRVLVRVESADTRKHHAPPELVSAGQRN